MQGLVNVTNVMNDQTHVKGVAEIPTDTRFFLIPRCRLSLKIPRDVILYKFVTSYDHSYNGPCGVLRGGLNLSEISQIKERLICIVKRCLVTPASPFDFVTKGSTLNEGMLIF